MGSFQGFHDNFTLVFVGRGLRVALYYVVFICCVALIVPYIHGRPVHLRRRSIHVATTCVASFHVLNSTKAEIGVDGLAVGVVCGQQAGIVGSSIDV